MKNWRKITASLLALAMVFSMAACGGDGGKVSSTAPESKPESTSSAPESKPESSEAESTPESKPAETSAEDLPRNETLYMGGIQWEKPLNMNPMSPDPHFFLISQTDVARPAIYETLYMFNALDGKAYPMLADGDYTWDADKKILTVKIKAAAKWSDGTAVTANDVAATFDAHVKYESPTGVDYGPYITVTAKDDATVEIGTKDDNYNPLKAEEYICKVYVMQKAYLEKLAAEKGDDASEMKTATMWDAPITGAYQPTMYDSDQKCICTRRDDYWGQDASMWGKLPVPKYLVHNIYSSNEVSATAFEAGQIDVNQSYVADLQQMWEEKGLPISTYIDEAPYQLGMSMPSMVFNCTKPGLDQKAVRKAIAIAVDYDQIVSSAMTGQSYTFAQVPRSLFNPTEGEQALIKDPETLKPYQFVGKDIEGANKLLDDAGIVDTNGDGIREYNGTELVFKCECPTGWTDWMAALTVVSDAGKEIGINLETYFPESAQWTADIQGGTFDIAMNTYSGASIANPWTRAYQTMYGFGGNFPETLTFSYSRYYNEDVDKILAAIPAETDEAKLKEYYEQLNIYYLDDCPAVALMYRPVDFHEVNETVWTNFPQQGDGTSIPPMICLDGYGYAAIFNLELVEG